MSNIRIVSSGQTEDPVIHETAVTPLYAGGLFFEIFKSDDRTGNAGQAGSFVLQQAFGVCPASAFLTDSVCHRDFDVGQKNCVDAVGATKRDDGLHFHTVLLHRKEQKRNAFLSNIRIVRSCQTENPVCDVRHGGPDLGTIDDVVLAVFREFGFGFQRRQIRSCTRLGIALAPVDLAGANVRQETFLLFCVAMSHEHRCQHADAEGHIPRQIGNGSLLLPDVMLSWRPAWTTKFLRPLWDVPATFFGGFGEPVQAPLIVVGASLIGVFCEECLHIGAKCEVFGAEIDVHCRISLSTFRRGGSLPKNRTVY